MKNIRAEIENAALDGGEVHTSKIEESGNVRRSFSFPPEFTGFAGHFPGKPILPAMLQTMTAQMLAEEALPEGAAFSGVKRAKFVHQIGPDTEVEVEVAWRRLRDQWSCNATLRAQNQAASNMTLIFDDKAV
jgi:3-hydroxyacyl-[acyl-carrier-protein] dehydratase